MLYRMVEDQKRLFFGFSIDAPWPAQNPEGRIIDENSRHVTLAFLGNHPLADLQKHLAHFPPPDFEIGPVGEGDELLFLPKEKPRVVASHLDWLEKKDQIETFHKHIQVWLQEANYPIDSRPLMSHITLARAPFNQEEWINHFERFPFIVTGIHLYQSVGNLKYQSIWEYPLIPAFEEFEHTADIAFNVKGHSFEDLYLHGAIAMSFSHPLFLTYLEKQPFKSIDEVVKGLNRMITKCDMEIGSPFKAVSYHSRGLEKENSLMNWEMIVDV